jgi:hypothetical protein
MIHQVPPGPDAVAGGEDLEDWAPLASGRRSRNRQLRAPCTKRCVPSPPTTTSSTSTPPGNRELQLHAMVAARHEVIPTKPDEASFDGLVRVAHLFGAVGPLNPGLLLLGVVLFGIETRATRIRHDARAQVARELGDGALVFDSDIRHLLAPARDSRGRGQLVHEYEDAVLAAPRFYEAGGTRRASRRAPHPASRATTSGAQRRLVGSRHRTRGGLPNCYSWVPVSGPTLVRG